MTGTHNQGFDRLVKVADALAGKITERIFVQTGNSLIEPKNCEWKKFLTPIELEKKIKGCSLVITHGGAGSIINSLKNKKPVIVVPREKKFNEHVNDHQIELAEKLEEEKKVVLCRNLNELINAIKKAKSLDKPEQNNKELIKEIELFLGN